MANFVFVTAFVPEHLMKDWLQHVRNFDTQNPGCHFEIGMDGPDVPYRDMVEIISVNPGFKFQHFFKREAPVQPVRVCIMSDAICQRSCTDRCARVHDAQPGQWEGEPAR